jgi:hypothetical protein
MGGAPGRVSRRQPAWRPGLSRPRRRDPNYASAVTGAARVVVEVVSAVVVEVVVAAARVHAARTGVVHPACVSGRAHARAARVVRVLGLVAWTRDVHAAARGRGGRARRRVDARAARVVRVVGLVAGAEMSTWVLSVSVVSVVPVEDAGSVEVPSDGPTAATTTAAKIPRSATERVNVIAFRMEGRMRDVPPAAAQAPVRAR